jgi:hypothetical protein
MSVGPRATEHLKAKPTAVGAVVGVIASLCCGGSLIFASVGLGIFYSDLGLWRYIPQALGAAIGLVVMAGSFIFLEWLNHAVVNAKRFLARPEYSRALIKGVPNVTLLYVCTHFFCARLALGAAISARRLFEHSRCRPDETSYPYCRLWGHDSPRHRSPVGRDALEQGCRNRERPARAGLLGL